MKIKHLFSALALFSFSNLAQAQNSEAAYQAFLNRDFANAINIYEKELASTPNNLEAQYRLGICYQITNQAAKAEKWFALALKDPNHINYVDLPYQYGEVLKMQGKYTEAKAAYQLLPDDFASIRQAAIQGCDFALANKQNASPFTVKNEVNVNSPESDFSPVLYQNKLYFASTRSIYLELFQAYSNGDSHWMYSSDRNLNTGALSACKPLFTPGAENQNLAPLGMNGDGKRIASTMQNGMRNGIRHLVDYNITTASLFFYTPISENNWALDNSLPFNHFKGQEGIIVSFPTLSADGKTLYFASNNSMSIGGMDIFVSFLENGQWTTPQNLGPNVNTAGDEIAPFIADDGTLYFASNYLPGFGGYDIFSATQKADKNSVVWGNVKNLGWGVNSAADDIYYVYDVANKQAYFSSNREGGKGDYDIYSAVVTGKLDLLANVQSTTANDIIVFYPNEFLPTSTQNSTNNIANNATTPTTPTPTTPTPTKPTTPTTTPTKPTTPTTAPSTPNNTIASNTDRNISTINNNKTASIDVDDLPCATNFYVGAILDASNNQPLQDVIIYIKNMHTQEKTKTTTNKYGEYSILLDPMTDYVLVASKSGYQNETFQVNTKDGGQRTILGTHALYQAGTVINKEVDVFGDPVASRGLGQNTTQQNTTQYTSINTYTGSTKYTPATAQSVMPDTGYLIQVGTFNKALNEAKIQQLSEYGNVITETKKNGAITYRVGIFAEKPHADKTLSEIKKIGYSDAWQLKSAIDNNSFAGKLSATTQVIFPYVATPSNPIVNTPNNASTPIIKEKTYDNWADNGQTASRSLGTNTAKNVSNNTVEYRIQLGAFKDISKVSFAHLSDLGNLYSKVESNGLTYFYIGNINTLEQAKNIKQKVEARGTNDAFIAAFKNGNRISLSEAASL